MKNATACGKALAALLKKLPKGTSPPWSEPDDPVEILVQSFLLMDASTDKAEAGFKRLHDRVVDFNDLRVSMAEEIVDFIGPRYPRALERCQRLRAALRSIYLREHSVTLAELKSAGKRDVKKYIESLDGMTPYVSARVMLLGFGTHAIPVDEQLRDHLIAAGAADESVSVADLSAWLARQIKATEGVDAHYALQAWSEKKAAASGRRTTTKKKTRSAPAKKTTKKKPAAKKSPAKKTTKKKKTTTRRKTSR